MKFLSVALGAALVSSVVATPPACLLACIAEVTKTSTCTGLEDVECLCTGLEKDAVNQCLSNICPNDLANNAKVNYAAACGFHK